MKIKLVVNTFPTASETFLFNLVTGLEKSGIKVTVCASAKSNETNLYSNKLKDWSGDIQIISTKPDSFSNFSNIAAHIISNPIFFFKLIRLKGFKKGFINFIYTSSLLKGKPDIIHFSFSGLGITYLDCLEHLKKAGVKTLVSCRGSAEKVKPLLEPERKINMRLLFSQIDLIHCVSKDMRDGLLSLVLISEKTFINYPSIETDKFVKKKSTVIGYQSKYSIITIGRLHFQKGYVYALQAVKQLAEKNIPFVYHILGEGPDRPMLTYLINELRLSDHVILHGKVNSEQVLEMLNDSDVFLLPSLYEGVSNAALEAMAMELPVISTQAGGMAEVIEHGENGLLTDWRTPDNMAEQLVWLYENPNEGIKMGKKARITVQSLFSLDNQINIFIDQYKSILNIN